MVYSGSITAHVTYVHHIKPEPSHSLLFPQAHGIRSTSQLHYPAGWAENTASQTIISLVSYCFFDPGLFAWGLLERWTLTSGKPWRSSISGLELSPADT